VPAQEKPIDQLSAAVGDPLPAQNSENYRPATKPEPEEPEKTPARKPTSNAVFAKPQAESAGKA